MEQDFDQIIDQNIKVFRLLLLVRHPADLLLLFRTEEAGLNQSCPGEREKTCFNPSTAMED